MDAPRVFADGSLPDAREAPGSDRSARHTERLPLGDEGRGLRFEDPYWDDAFCAWLDPTMRTCCG